MVSVFHRLFNQHEFVTISTEVLPPKMSIREMEAEWRGYDDPVEMIRELTEPQTIYHLQCIVCGDRKRVRA